MSICSGLSYTPSILKNSSTIFSKIKSTPTRTKVRFELPHSKKINKILRDYLKKENLKDYEHLICLIRDSELTDDDLSSLLKEVTECISVLDNNFRLFIDVILALRWIDREKKFVNEYQSFLINLLVAHNYHARIVIDQLVSLFLPAPSEELWENGIPSEADRIKCVNIHSVINTLLKVVPMCKNVFLNSLINLYPYFKRGVHIHEYYLHNLLWILDYQPLMREDILRLIFSKLVLLDVNAPRDVVNSVYSEGNEEEMCLMDASTIGSSLPLSNDVTVETLDVCLSRMFNYITIECYDSNNQELDWDKTKELYKDLLKVFDDIILPTYNCHHVQFCWFILCGFKPTLTEAFLDHLWEKVTNPNAPAVLRQSAVEYIASLVTRATYVTSKKLKSVLKQLTAWIHAYINTQDGLESVTSDVRIHSVFYAACQALFYITTFRHKELISTKKNMTLLQNLNFTKIVTSRLNPLRVCQPAVVQNFAAFTRNYQLAYCFAIIEHNTRNVMPTVYRNDKGSMVQVSNVLETNFPFDPFLLKRACGKVRQFYREYEELDLEIHADNENNQKETEMDDFLEQDFHSAKKCKFSYSTSPGYKFNL